MTEIVGITAGMAGTFYDNIFLPLYLSMSDRDLLSKHGDRSDWIELKVSLSSVVEVKKGNRRYWLLEQKTYSAALYQSGYAKKGLVPINLFKAGSDDVDLFLNRKTVA